MDEKTQNLLKRAVEALKAQKEPTDSHEVSIKLQEPGSTKMLTDEVKQTKLSLKNWLTEILAAIKSIKLQSPDVTLNSPDEVAIKKPNWLREVFSLKRIEDSLDTIQENLKEPKEEKELKFPTSPDEAVPVRLSDGKKFIEQLTQVIQSGGGGTSIPKATSTASGQTNTIVVPVSNADGSNIFGPSAPNVVSYSHSSISLSSGADQTIVSAVAGKQIWVYGIGFTTTAQGTVSFQDTSNTDITGVMSFAQYSGLSSPPSGNFAMPIWKVETGKGLQVDLVTAGIKGWLDYAIISV